MSRRSTDGRGGDIVLRLFTGRAEANGALRNSARDLPILRGVTPKCQFTQPQENVLAAAAEILIDSGRVFLYGNSVVYDGTDGDEQALIPLRVGWRAEPHASALLSNLFVCGTAPRNQSTAALQFPPPARFVQLLLAHEPTVARLPKINLYATRPVFDEHFNLRSRGWHRDVSYMVHGPCVEPILPDSNLAAAECLRDRLPHYTREALRDFCFRSDTDLVNTVGGLLTGLLVGAFIEGGKAVILVDGNRPGLGKTLLARVIGIILDDGDPKLVRFTEDVELEKRLCAHFRGSCKSVLLIDNARVGAGGTINSTVIEANSTAPMISLRILGQSTNFTRPNDMLWFVTMNHTRANADLLSRSMPIQLHYDGNPEERQFDQRDPLEFARQHRLEILGELAGMVVRWTEQGQEPGQRQHRLKYWAAVMDGILEANSLPGFMSNREEACGDFNVALDELAALAENAIQLRLPMIHNL